MRIVIAPQGFKGTLSGILAARAIEAGVLRVLPDADVVLVPMADGGHGTLDALLDATGGQRSITAVAGPRGNAVNADWGVLGDGATAIVEMAQASGLTLVLEDQHDPMHATTYGTGQLIAAALEAGYRKIIVGVGGSATNDGGAGAAQALGVRLTDPDGIDVALGAEGLLALAHADVSQLRPEILRTEILVATDVSNPLTGPDGAAFTYGPQKGATPEMLPVLDLALANMANVVERDLGPKLLDVPGMGAAGGLAGGLVGFLGASLLWGAEVVADAIGLDERLARADLVITGEGRIDWQTVFNKAPIEVVKRASARGIPVIGIGGSLGPGADDVLAHGMTLIQGCVAPEGAVPTTEAQAEASLANATELALSRWLGRS